MIVDFGSCWVANLQEAGAPIKRDTILGALDYSAPEYRYGGPTSNTSDLFSLTVLLYEMLADRFAALVVLLLPRQEPSTNHPQISATFNDLWSASGNTPLRL